MNYPKAVIAGCCGGLIGAGIWAAVAHFLMIESGWIALIVGAIVGACVQAAAGREANPVYGCMAALIAFCSIVGGKYLVVTVEMNELEEIASGSMATIEEDIQNDEYVISWLADEVVEVQMSEGRTIYWPDHIDPFFDVPEAQVDYPADIWAEASGQWAMMSFEDRANYRQYVRESMVENIGAFTAEMGDLHTLFFISTFGILDIVFFGLAVVGAFRLASTPPDEVPEGVDGEIMMESAEGESAPRFPGLPAEASGGAAPADAVPIAAAASVAPLTEHHDHDSPVQDDPSEHTMPGLPDSIPVAQDTRPPLQSQDDNDFNSAAA